MSISVLILGCASFFYQASEVGVRHWTPAVSQEGEFSVELPTRPNRQSTRMRSSPGGHSRVIEIGAKTESAEYLAQRFDIPTGIVRGAEQSHLDAERDQFARDYRGRVVTEKRVTFEGKPGRDFTIRAEPTKGGGVVMIRVREYASGKAIFALMVVSVPNHELPDDAGRFLGSLRFGSTREPDSKTQVLGPEATGKPLAGWGLAVDPDGDCKITPKGKDLSIEVPGTLHDLNADIDRLNAPRVLRTVEGDFEIQVRVVGDFRPKGPSTNPKSIPCNGAGLFIWRDAGNYIRLERFGMLRNGNIVTVANFEEREEANRGAVHNAKIPPGDILLKLIRRGGRVQGGVSVDGRNWQVLQPIDVAWPARVKVGLAVVNSDSSPLAVKFEGFSLKGKVVKEDDQ
ncbi:DUF1349 domain-containing protein [Singulisphaera sp. PoT]|uniref:DUF1349 domain-containing protein n=1 Tax=Singulisphaera sp. PoT TaxID=3411797 RepID=UPI003BF4A8E3